MIALSGQRYDPQTDEIKLIGEKCPTRKQNREYVMYLLKVLYLESNVRDSPCVGVSKDYCN